MVALARVGVLVEMGAVEQPEPVRIVREMARDPIEDDADSGRMRGLDEMRMKSSGVPKRLVGANSDTGWYPHDPSNGNSVTGRSSRWVKPMILDVGDEPVGELGGR